ncbi:MAG: AAA family ATPase, partial [Bacteroidia bacterium]|nr:AAA family ATPase [Bacteroidia bacterium]
MDNKITEAQTILKELGLPEAQQNRICALTLLALGGIKPNDEWENISAKSLTLSKDIIEFVNEYYQAGYKPNTRESFRKIALKPFVENNIALLNPDNPDLSLTSSKKHYALSYIALNTIKKFNTSEWEVAKENYLKYNSQNPKESESFITIKTIQINSYKSIVNDKIELGRFNVFIGANGCGKTNILEAIATVGAERGNDLTFDGLYSRGVRIARPDLMLSSFLNNNQQSSIEINLTFEENKQEDNYKCSLSPTNANDIYTKWINLAEEDIYPDILLNYFDSVTRKYPGISGEDLLIQAGKLIEKRGGLRRNYNFDSFLSEYAIFDLNTKSLRGISSTDSKKTPLGINGEGLELLIASFNQSERTILNKCLYFFDWLG